MIHFSSWKQVGFFVLPDFEGLQKLQNSNFQNKQSQPGNSCADPCVPSSSKEGSKKKKMKKMAVFNKNNLYN